MSRAPTNRPESNSTRQRIDAGFERWGHWVAGRPWLVILATVLPALAFATQARNLELDTHPERFLDRNHAVRLQYNDFKDQFGQDDVIIVAIRSDALWTVDFLTWLEELHVTLEEEVPHLEEVTSLVNARLTRGEAGELVVEDLMEGWEQTEEDVARIRDLAMGNPVYRNLLVNDEADVTTVVLELAAYESDGALDLTAFEDDSESHSAPVFLSGNERNRATTIATEIVERHRRPDLEIHVVGLPSVALRVIGDSQRNMVRFTAISFSVIMIVLAVLFRRVTGVFLPLLVALLAVAATFGIAAMRDEPLNVAAQMIPSLVLAVGVSATIHLLVLFYDEVDRGESRAHAIASALGHSGLPIVLSAGTTAAGISSFNAAELAMLQDVGIYAPLGILIGLTLALTLLPALLAIFPAKVRAPISAGESKPPDVFERTLVAMGDLGTGRPVAVVVAATVLSCVVGLGVFRLYYLFDPLTFLPEDDALRQSTYTVNDYLKGVVSAEVIIETGMENGLHDPQLLHRMNQIHRITSFFRGGVDNGIEVGKTLSLVDILKEINQALNENQKQFYAVPQSRPLIAQELLLFENSGSDDLESLVDSQFSRARFTLRLPWIAPSHFGSFLDDVEAVFTGTLGPDVRVWLTGLVPLMTVVQEEMKVGLFTSYSLALIIITPLMMLLIGSVRGGLVSMVPNLLPILLVLGLIGWVGIELSVFTMMIGCLAIGLAVDDTIHFIHQFYRYRAFGQNPREAVRSTMRTTGRALLTTSVVLGCGFIVYAFAGLRNLAALGYVTTAAIALALLADLLIAPALLALVSGERDDPPT